MNTCKVQELRLAGCARKGSPLSGVATVPKSPGLGFKNIHHQRKLFFSAMHFSLARWAEPTPALGLELCRSRPSPGHPEDRNSESFLGAVGDTGIDTHSGAETPAPGHKPLGGIPHSRRTRRGQGEKQIDWEGMCQDANKAGYPG